MLVVSMRHGTYERTTLIGKARRDFVRLHMGWCQTTQEALDHYAHCRTHNRQGVTIPSQRRYVEYYARMLRLTASAEFIPHLPKPQLVVPGQQLRLLRVRAGPFVGMCFLLASTIRLSYVSSQVRSLALGWNQLSASSTRPVKSGRLTTGTERM